MARTYNIACVDCKLTLWIGQWSGSDISGAYIYTTDEDIQKQRDFFYGHLGHRLEFDQGQVLDVKYDLKDVESDEEEESSEAD